MFFYALPFLNTVFLSNLSHQCDSTVPHRTKPHRTETLLFKNAVTFKRDVFDPPQHATLNFKIRRYINRYFNFNVKDHRYTYRYRYYRYHMLKNKALRTSLYF
jgi:hypothetical protein